MYTQPPIQHGMLATIRLRRFRSCWPRFRRSRALERVLAAAIIGAGLFGGTACKDLVGTQSLPAGTADPANFRTPEGARSAYRGAISFFSGAFASFLGASGIFTDELQVIVGLGQNLDSRDFRNIQTGGEHYGWLQGVRGQTAHAIGALAAYAPQDSVLRGEMYALQAYAEVLLADFYCSGIPLSTLDFEQDYTYHPGSSTTDVYRHAKALFDTALTLSGDSARILNLAKVGRGRALLALGDYNGAANAVAGVPNDFQYVSSSSSGVPLTSYDVSGCCEVAALLVTVSDREGVTGLPYRSSRDPRTATISGTATAVTSVAFGTYYYPAKYGPIQTPVAFVLASGVEARLIEAEAALQAHSLSWLTILNTLRTTGTIDGVTVINDTTITDHGDGTADTTVVYARTDTAWHSGTGGIIGLRPLTDPGVDSARVSLLFTERAEWLFLTGHRQGDLRRMIRQYHRHQQDIYPSQGRILNSFERYGSEIVLPITSAEEGANPLFHGCINYAA